jgi:hypothetical protein
MLVNTVTLYYYIYKIYVVFKACAILFSHLHSLYTCRRLVVQHAPVSMQLYMLVIAVSRVKIRCSFFDNII